ncbi:MAG: tetratricopeptide repeat protein [Acetobacteraceae bacterium]|nr:tetratricopeptide repeat protein [Acetobacteraceae bacterium]
MSAPTTAFIPILLSAVADQQAGRLEQAARGFSDVLALEPDQPQALLFGGVLALRMGQADRSAALLERAVAVRPTLAETHFAHGNALWAAARKLDARAAWQRAIQLDPEHIGALLNLAQAQDQSGEAELAAANCRAAIAICPDRAQPWVILSSALRTLGEPQPALEAAAAAIRLDPTSAAAFHQRGMSLKQLGRPTDAADALCEALAHDPGFAPSHLNLANLLHDAGNLAAALAHCRAAIAADPAMAEAHAVLGFLLTEAGDLAGAVVACEQAVSFAPDLPEGHWNLGIAQLSAGDLAAGFARYEWRKRHPLYRNDFFSLPDPEWTGQPLDGKRIVIVAEQGLGDAIMFARYAAVLAERGAIVSIACDQRLISLLKQAPGVSAAFAKARSMPGFDLWVDQMSLPFLCKTTLETIPSPLPYLSAGPERAARWRARLPAPDGRRRVGLVWAGNPLHSNDANRSCPAPLFRGITDHPAVAGVSLQVGSAAGQAPAIGLQDWSSQLTDYAETAGLIANLDLVISVDTSVAHLAAAMGKPTWIMLPHCPEWRWLRGRDDTPWHRCVRLFRQPSPRDWDSVVGAVQAALSAPAEQDPLEHPE